MRARTFCRRVIKAATRLGLKVQILGHVSDLPILFISPEKSKTLVIGTLHGDEPAGCFGILQYLETCESTNLSFIPLVNPTGLDLKTRRNAEGLDPNRGYCAGTSHQKPSEEGALILSHQDLLEPYKSIVTFHEDTGERRFYSYIYPRSKKLAACISNALSKHFDPVPEGESPDGDDLLVKDHGLHDFTIDGTVEDWASIKMKKAVVCAETPARQPLKKRVAAYATVLKALDCQ